MITRETIERARDTMRDQPYRGCYHVVHPAGPGLRWEIVAGPGEGTVVIRCANLCGWIARARAVPV